MSKVLYLNSTSLEILDRERVQKVQSVSMIEGAIEPVRMAPGEGYEAIFKIKASNSSSDTQKILKEIDQFAELQFNWYSQSLSAEDVPLLNSISANVPSISCSLPSPLLTLIQIPVKMRFANESSL